RAAWPPPAGVHRQHAAGRGGPPRRRVVEGARDLDALALAGQLAPSSRIRRHALGRAPDLSRPAGRPDRQPGLPRLSPRGPAQWPRGQHRAEPAGGLRGPSALSPAGGLAAPGGDLLAPGRATPPGGPLDRAATDGPCLRMGDLDDAAPGAESRRRCERDRAGPARRGLRAGDPGLDHPGAERPWSYRRPAPRHRREGPDPFPGLLPRSRDLPRAGDRLGRPFLGWLTWTPAPAR